MSEINKNLYPPDGYVFRETDGSHHRGSNWKSLEDRVRTYREINGLPAGDVWGDIEAQICVRIPHFCRSQTKTPVRRREGSSLNGRVTGWIGRQLGTKRAGRITFASDEEARRRAAICGRCPQQQALSKTCGDCLRQVAKARAVIFGRKPLVSQNLEACGVLGEDSTLAIHINQPSADPNGLPADCWRRP